MASVVNSIQKQRNTVEWRYIEQTHFTQFDDSIPNILQRTMPPIKKTQLERLKERVKIMNRSRRNISSFVPSHSLAIHQSSPTTLLEKIAPFPLYDSKKIIAEFKVLESSQSMPLTVIGDSITPTKLTESQSIKQRQLQRLRKTATRVTILCNPQNKQKNNENENQMNSRNISNKKYKSDNRKQLMKVQKKFPTAKKNKLLFG